MSAAAHAKAYAALGWPVFPCKHGSKEPKTKNGVLDATTSPPESWFSNGANLALAAGDDFWVLDVDPRNGGDVTLAELVDKYGELPDTLHAQTRDNGRHLFFAPDARIIKNGTGVIGAGLDHKVKGGYVLVEPSEVAADTPGAPGRYSFLDWEPLTDPAPTLASAPEWLVQLAMPTKPKNPANGGGGGNAETDLRSVLKGVPEGSRDDHLYKYACSLRARNATHDEAELLVLHAAEKCDPPFPVSQAEKCLESAWKHPPGVKADHTDEKGEAFDGDVLGLFTDLILNQEDVDRMADADFLVPDMIVRGHVAAYVSQANGGKTTVFIHLCEELKAIGMRVLYINADANPSDLKAHFAHAVAHGYDVIAPDAKAGMGTADVMSKLAKMNASNSNLSEYVFIIDTVKKFADMIDKKQQKELYKLLRGLSTKGATICLLGHVNKHLGADGKTIFEGTGDVRNDLDELIYLDTHLDEAKGIRTVTTRPDKVRARFSPVSYEIHLDTRSVTRLDRVAQILTDEDREILSAIITAIRDGNEKQESIAGAVNEAIHVSKKRVRGILNLFGNGASRLFERNRSSEKNALLFSLTEAGEAWK